MRVVFLILIVLHGLIHLMGFLKAFHIAEWDELVLTVSKPYGVFWLLVALIIFAAGWLYVLKHKYWWLMAFLSVLLSQVLIFIFWNDAWFGTIANLLILMGVLTGYGKWGLENKYGRDVAEGLKRSNKTKVDILSENDIQHLPPQVQNYLRYTGGLDKPRVNNMKFSFEAEMRAKNQDWFELTSEQYNFFDKLERLFFLRAKVKGLPATGYHRYKNGQASMLIKLMSLIPVVNVSGKEMFQAETVTMLNDMCLFAPATLIDKKIKWETLDARSVKAIFTNRGVTVSAILYFNEKNQLVNFVSDDRYEVNEMKKYRFSTPVSQYRQIGGHTICSYGEAVWHYAEGEFVYGKFNLMNLEYNVIGSG